MGGSVIRIIDSDRAEPICYSAPVLANKKLSFLVHSTTRDAPYIHLSHDSILEL